MISFNDIWILDYYISKFKFLVIHTISARNKGICLMEIYEEEKEIYNAKLRLLSWLYDEIKIQSGISKDLLNEKGQKLPLNH